MVHSTNRFYVFFLLTTLILFQGCVIIETPPHPKTWPTAAHRDNTNHWSGYIPVNSLQQLSEIYKSQDLITFQQKGYRPYLKIKGVWIADLLFIDSTFTDTVTIWSTHEKGPYKWDKLKKIKAKISNDEIVFIKKYPFQGEGGNPFVGFSRDYIKLYKSTENDLLIRNGYKFTGLIFMLVPTIGHTSEWNKYESEIK
ncbi:MAG: hypothetical protein RL516_1114 [Bacteroidota bacterium]|jgi:hypothetical protein